MYVLYVLCTTTNLHHHDLSYSCKKYMHKFQKKKSPATFYVFGRRYFVVPGAGTPSCILHADLGPGRALWRALSALKVAASWLFSRYRFPSSQSRAGPWKPRTVFSPCCCALIMFLIFPQKLSKVRQTRHKSRRAFKLLLL